MYTASEEAFAETRRGVMTMIETERAATVERVTEMQRKLETVHGGNLDAVAARIVQAEEGDKED